MRICCSIFLNRCRSVRPANNLKKGPAAVCPGLQPGPLPCPALTQIGGVPSSDWFPAGYTASNWWPASMPVCAAVAPGAEPCFGSDIYVFVDFLQNSSVSPNEYVCNEMLEFSLDRGWGWSKAQRNSYP